MFNHVDRDNRVKTLFRKFHRLQRSDDYIQPFAPGVFQLHSVQIEARSNNLFVFLRGIQQMSLAASDLEQPYLLPGREVRFDFGEDETVFQPPDITFRVAVVSRAWRQLLVELNELAFRGPRGCVHKSAARTFHNTESRPLPDFVVGVDSAKNTRHPYFLP